MIGSYGITQLAEAKEFYWEKGWVRVRQVFSADESLVIADLATEMAFKEMEKSQDEPYLLDTKDDGGYVPRKIDWPYLKHKSFKSFVTDERLLMVIKSILGHSACIIRDQIYLKPPRFGSPKPYHQDNAHFLCSPVDELITAWIALDDATAENGCLTYLDSSHKDVLHKHLEIEGERHNIKPVDDAVLEGYNESFGLALRGDVLLHHGQTMHRSGKNHTDEWRRGYATHWIGPSVKSENDTLKWAYNLIQDGVVVQNYPVKKH